MSRESGTTQITVRVPTKWLAELDRARKSYTREHDGRTILPHRFTRADVVRVAISKFLEGASNGRTG